jgi:glycosyltransferase involved in cell wall biosynthesis
MISVVIPAYNQEKYICDALDSIASQTQSVSEIIIVDDGSTDDTEKKVNYWASKNTAIELNYIKTENGGVSTARNIGINASKHEWIALLDGDDIWLPHHIKTLLETLKTYPDVSFVFADATRFGDNLCSTKTRTNYLQQDKITPHMLLEKGDNALLAKSFQEELIKGSFIPCCSTLIKKTDIIKCGGFDVNRSYAEDRECWLRMFSTYQVAVCLKAVSKVRHHAGNQSRHNAINKNMAKIMLVDELLLNSHKYTLNEKCTKQLQLHLKVLGSALVYSASLLGVRQLLITKNDFCCSRSINISIKDYIRALCSSFS